MKTWQAVLLIIIVLIIDQVSKILVKTNMFWGQEIEVLGNFFVLHFTENEGMAFGWEFGGKYGKLFLSLFRIFAIGIFTFYLHKLIKSKMHGLLIFSISLIIAGALGNIVDSVFYGQMFEESSYFKQNVAVMFPENGGYAPWLQGRVVDMLHFNMFKWPEWVPGIGGNTFFEPVFNVADSAISAGVLLIIAFQRRIFRHKPIGIENEEVAASTKATNAGQTAVAGGAVADSALKESITSGYKLANHLEELKYFKFADKTDVLALKEQMIKSVDGLKKPSTLFTEEPKLPKCFKLFPCDCNDLLEESGYDLKLSEIKSAFVKRGLAFNIGAYKEDFSNGKTSVSFKLNGKEYQLFDKEKLNPEEKNKAVSKLIWVINDQLEALKENEKAYPISSGSDGQLVFLTSQEFNAFNAILENAPNRPMTSAAWKVEHAIA